MSLWMNIFTVSGIFSSSIRALSMLDDLHFCFILFLLVTFSLFVSLFTQIVCMICSNIECIYTFVIRCQNSLQYCMNNNNINKNNVQKEKKIQENTIYFHFYIDTKKCMCLGWFTSGARMNEHFLLRCIYATKQLLMWPHLFSLKIWQKQFFFLLF